MYQKYIFKYRTYPRGFIIPQEKCLQNTLYFLLKGTVKVHSTEYPDTVFSEGQFILQPIGSRVSFLIMEKVECIIYLFDRLQNICNDRFTKGNAIAETTPLQSVVMTMCPPLHTFMEGMKMYLDDEMLCKSFLQAKRIELAYLFNCYYPIKELATFLSPIYRYTKSFQYFVMQNYQQAKDVEEFAKIGGYSIPTFRRLFKEAFDEPAYQWMLKKKCQDIYNDLITTELSVSDICYQYGFESLANFSHFCRANFGKSPRALRIELGKKP